MTTITEKELQLTSRTWESFWAVVVQVTAVIQEAKMDRLHEIKAFRIADHITCHLRKCYLEAERLGLIIGDRKQIY